MRQQRQELSKQNITPSNALPLRCSRCYSPWIRTRHPDQPIQFQADGNFSLTPLARCRSYVFLHTRRHQHPRRPKHHLSHRSMQTPAQDDHLLVRKNVPQYYTRHSPAPYAGWPPESPVLPAEDMEFCRRKRLSRKTPYKTEPLHRAQ